MQNTLVGIYMVIINDILCIFEIKTKVLFSTTLLVTTIYHIYVKQMPNLSLWKVYKPELSNTGTTSQGIIVLGEPAHNTGTFTFLSEALKSPY
jgi:hypothetical protein